MINFFKGLFYFFRGLLYCVVIGFYRVVYAIVNFRLQRRIKKLEKLLDENGILKTEIKKQNWRLNGEGASFDLDQLNENGE